MANGGGTDAGVGGSGIVALPIRGTGVPFLAEPTAAAVRRADLPCEGGMAISCGDLMARAAHCALFAASCLHMAGGLDGAADNHRTAALRATTLEHESRAFARCTARGNRNLVAAPGAARHPTLDYSNIDNFGRRGVLRIAVPEGHGWPGQWNLFRARWTVLCET